MRRIALTIATLVTTAQPHHSEVSAAALINVKTATASTLTIAKARIIRAEESSPAPQIASTYPGTTSAPTGIVVV
nr:hypothetical protein [Nocardia sp. 348MFTsu5.1]